MIDGINLMERPKELDGKTMRMKSGCGTMHITINSTDEKPIFEIFTVGGKNGSCSSVFLDVMNILITRCLRLGDDPYEIVEVLKNMDCPKSNGCDKVSCPEGIGKAMEDYLDENYDFNDQEVNEYDLTKKREYTKKENYDSNNSLGYEECPECGEEAFNPTAEGCAICLECGFSPCG